MTYSIQAQEERDFHVATDAEWDAAGAAQIGSEDRDRAWILSDRDVWYANPYYNGPKVRHPEDDDYEEEGEVPASTADYDDIPF